MKYYWGTIVRCTSDVSRLNASIINKFRNMRASSLLVIGTILQQQTSQAFQAGLLQPSANSRAETSYRSLNLQSSPADNRNIAESILDEFHRSNLSFRIVVIGNGAILETTSKLGPTSPKSSISPKSGERLLTFANEDASFELHVKVDQVCKIAFVINTANNRRVARFLSDKGAPICSLILAGNSDTVKAEEWFDGLVAKHGDEIVL